MSVPGGKFWHPLKAWRAAVWLAGFEAGYDAAFAEAVEIAKKIKEGGKS